jgi:hypothetical protein
MELSLDTNWLRSYETKESNRAVCFSVHIAQRFYRFRGVYNPESIPLVDPPATTNILSLFGNFIPSTMTSISTTTSSIPTSITAQPTGFASSHRSTTAAHLNSVGVPTVAESIKPDGKHDLSPAEAKSGKLTVQGFMDAVVETEPYVVVGTNQSKRGPVRRYNGHVQNARIVGALLVGNELGQEGEDH